MASDFVSRQRTFDLRSAVDGRENRNVYMKQMERARMRKLQCWHIYCPSEDGCELTFVGHDQRHCEADNMVLHKPENKHVLKAFDLSGKVAAVTGGARGIGLEVSRGLAEAGAHVHKSDPR